MPAARMPTANSAARSGGDWITMTSRSETCGPRIPTAATTSVTAATMTAAPRRRTAKSNSGNRRYSCASTAIDQKARLGLGALTRFCVRRPLTTTALASGRPCPGAGTISHATARLKSSAAQYGGRMRRARRSANPDSESRCQPWRAGERASEKPESTMNTTTANRP
jgi:hypothetical protein